MIELKNVTKFYKTKKGKKFILKDVSFTIPPKVNIGILGRNGAGKSTFMRMLGGIDFPNQGTIVSDNSFSWPLALSGGFIGNMTGRDNVKFVCRLYSKTDEETKEIVNKVEEFCELGEYFDMPIKKYSSGMKSRVSFGLSLSFDFDYILIDETLAVGDKKFREKSKEALKKKIEKCNIILVSHQMKTLKDMCDVGILLHNNKLTYFEDIKDAIDAYNEINK